MAVEKVRVGIIGCGTISEIYLKNLTSLFKEIEVLGVCDVNKELARSKAERYGLPRRYADAGELLADEDIEAVLDLCPPLLHYDINRSILEAGKSVYSEKPLAAEYSQACELERMAEKRGLYIGCSPDTVLGASIQTCRWLVDSGAVGRVVGCSANLIKRGVETWHPNPNFLYQPGGGPLLDMGPYYINTLLQLMGGAASVAGMTGISFKTRVITSQPHFGEIIRVNVPTYVNALLRFRSGAMGELSMTFDVHKASLPFIEIYGSEGSLSVPDPNCFGAGPISLYRPERGEWMEIPQMFGYSENSRGLGLADMANAIRRKRKNRADGKAACHTVEIMEKIIESAEQGRELKITSEYERPAAMTKSSAAGIIE